ncbi:MAG: TonB-dependent receptor [Glaciecola sp.]|jgi:iron complex outermembrane receptor protein
MNQSNDTKLHKVSMAVLVALGCLAAPNLYAQETDDLLEEEEEEVAEVVERISVTGSRIKRDEFSNASPIQVVSGEISRELGLFDATEMLQTTSQVSGLQIDNTFGGFVLDNGPGASTIGFRGLGADRTLVLINGRRMAPAGVGGAPSSPDLNLIPSVIIDRIENLFDGASTVYGSDAIAGVANVILRSNVEGFDFQGSFSNPQASGGEETTFSAMYGASGDNYSFNVAAEYFERKTQTYADSAFASDCNEYYHEGNDGNIYTQYRGIGPNINPPQNCKLSSLINRVSLGFFGSVYYTEGFTNIGIPNFSDSGSSLGNVPFINGLFAADTNGDGIPDAGIYDGDGDGLRDVDFQDPFYNASASDYVNQSDWLSPNKRFSLFANGDYLFNDENDTRFYYEALYAQRASDVFNNGAQFFQGIIPADHPLNICGTDPINGNNCYATTGLDAFFGDTRLDIQPIISVRGDRENSEVDVSQFRLAAGLNGNIGLLDGFGEGNWTYEVSATHSASDGKNTISGISQARIDQSLNNAVRNADGSITCGTDCVVVDLLSPTLYQLGAGDFATQAERDFLFIDRIIETEVKQTVFGGFITGDLFNLPWNDQTVPLVVGAEWRKDEIITDANDVAADGLLAGFFSDQGADGSRIIREVFFETEFPLLRGQEYAEELTVTAAGRITEESFYSAEQIWSLKGIYRPNEWLTIRGTRGTSYRAPNLRERFLNGTSGFGTVFDPCVVPEAARVGNITDPSAGNTYDAALDTRETRVLDACRANNLDPTSLGINVLGSGSGYQSEITTGGTQNLNPETSTSTTYGFVIEQPFTDAFDLTLSVTRYDIDIENGVAEPSASFVAAQCYDNIDQPNGDSGFCAFLERGDDGLIDNVDSRFINIGLEGSEGTDYNIFYNQAFVVGDQELDVTVDIIGTKLKSAEFQIFETFDDNKGEPAFPEWRGSARLSLAYSDFRFNWFTRYIDAGQADEPPTFEDDNPPCNGIANVSCRAVYYTDNYTVHNASLTYSMDDLAVTVGVRNVFNDAPPKVDTAGVFATRNIPLGVGYDTRGRTGYISFGYTF